MVEVLASVIESKLALLEVQIERTWVHASEPAHACLGVAPEAFDAVDVIAANGATTELVASMIDAQVLLVAHVHQAVVALEAVGVDDRAEIHFASHRGQNHTLFTTLDDLGVDLAMSLAHTKHDRLSACTSASFAFDTTRPEVAFVNFDVPSERSLELARLSHALAQRREQTVHRVAVQRGELRDLHRRQIGGDASRETTEKCL